VTFDGVAGLPIGGASGCWWPQIGSRFDGAELVGWCL